MQFHLNGFRAQHPASDQTPARSLSPLPQVDVLIVGSGPTGLTLAAQLAAFPGVKTRIMEQRAGPLRLGQADGIACRTMEMFEAFGFCERVMKEAYWVNETCFWKPDDSHPGHILRGGAIQDVEEGLSEFPHVILNQARIHDFYLDLMRNAPSPLEPDYSRRLVGLTVDDQLLGDPAAHALTARFERADPSHAAIVETVNTRFIVGCDGARSAVRQFMGLALDGDSDNQAWGVMDVLAVTDFPDIRRKAAIHSAEAGSMLIIPREGGYLVRLYIELDKLRNNERVAALNVTTDHLIATARRILSPYTLEVKEIAWWSVYEIGQRLCQRFDDLAAGHGGGRFPRMFIAGDACHTHSPKAGQGMNVSMQDAFNLGWKLAAVIDGRAAPRLLATYSEERRAVAQELIDFDHKFARMFSARPKGSQAAGDLGIDPVEFQNYFMRSRRFTAGTETCYPASLVTGNSTHQHLAKKLLIGMRFHSAPVVRLADARQMHLGHTVRADGRWRLFAFADGPAPTDDSSALRALCEFLQRSPTSPVAHYTKAGEDIDALLEFIAISQQAHHDLSIVGLPDMLLPRKGGHGLIDYEKVYCSLPGDDIFDLRGIDRQRGALVIVRPDQYVAHVLPLDAYDELGKYFDAFLREVGSRRPIERRPLR